MTGGPLERLDMRRDLYLLAEQADIPRAVKQLASERARDLIPHKKHRRFGTPEVIFEVVTYPARLAHSRRRYYHLRRFIVVYLL